MPLAAASAEEGLHMLDERDINLDRVRAESLNALRTDLETFVQEQVPEAAAKIIREEIQGLLRSGQASPGVSFA